MPALPAAAPAAAPNADAADLQALLDVSLTALVLLRPLFAARPSGAEADPAEIADFACAYLNPAGQRMLGVPDQQPAETLLTLFPHARENGLLAFYCGVWASGEPGRFEVNYQADGLDNYFYVAARRQGDQLAVSFTDTASQDRSAVETALRASQTAEAAALAEAESQRQRLAEVLMELPAQVATWRGPDHVFSFVNPRYQAYFGGQPLLGRPLREVLPETAEQGILTLLDRVYQTGEPYHAEAAEVWFDFARTGQRQQVFLDLFFHPLRDAQGAVVGVLDFSYDVTEQVRARQALDQAAGQLRQLNDELEERVEVRTQALRAHADEARRARLDAEQQRASLVRFLSQTQAAICVLRGPVHMLDYCNPAFERLFLGHSLQPGRPLTEVFPGAVAQGLVAPLNAVFSSGVSYFGVERELVIVPPADGQPARPHYFTFSFDAYQEQGRTAGVSIFAYDVTAAVLARRQNEALQVQALAATARQLQERQNFHQVFEQTPAAICLLRGPAHRYEYVNPAYQALFPGRELAGRAVAEAVPEAVDQGFLALLDGVYRTGEPYCGYEMPLALPAADGSGETRTRYYTFTYQRVGANDGDEKLAGISVFGQDVSEQVWEREAHARQQQQLRELFEQAPVSIAVLRGPRYVFELANHVTGQLLGRPVAELLGRGLFEAVPETAGLGFEALLDGVMATGVPFVAHESPSRIARDGRVEAIYWNYVYYPLREADGRITGIITVATDATAEVLARQQNEVLQAEVLTAARLQEQERDTLYGIFEQTPALICLLREPVHTIVYHNLAYQRLFPGRELRGRNILDVLPEVAVQGFVALLDTVYQTGETYFGTETPFELAPPDGGPARVHYFNFTYQTYQENGATAGISVFAYDVTEQVRARHERENQQRQLRELFEQAPVAIGLFAGPDYVVEVCNPDLQAIWRRTAAEALDRPLFEVLPEARDQGFRELLDEVRRTGTPFVAAEMPAQLLRNGQLTSVYLNFVYQPIRDEQGHIRAVAAVAADVSEQVAARRLLAQTNIDLTAANEQLTRTNADLDSFVYVASHDLKQPISNIEGLLLALREHLPATALATDHVAPMLDMMQAAIGRFQLTIRQLTDVSRLQQAQTEPVETVNLAALVGDLRLDLASLLVRTATELHLDIAHCSEVLFAPGQLRSILYNLLSNAIKYQHPDRPPVITLRCRRPTPAGATVLEVQDNGLGLSAAQQSKLFGLFVRLHDHVEGTGIGLYMVRKMVENAGGTIAVVSQLGVGTTFTVTLPAAGAGAAEQA